MTAGASPPGVAQAKGRGVVSDRSAEGVAAGRTEAPFDALSVLVVEDESFTRMVLAKMLGTLGVKAVHQAADGESGLAAVAAHSPDLVLCDVEMQPMDGFGFVRALRASADSRQRSLPVLFMSGRVDDDRKAQAQDSGADAVLAKPVTPASLRDALGIGLRAIELKAGQPA
ncbi:response regulator [Azospirillum lipoferum]|uniref:Response regulator n=1 Tax=Azospirillum lipoferum TaxID=193 RepID=A0A5A9GWG9_AZOLI|nr:response regulator [Azospirillum lipoferum]KAA0597914.1 response regulator [Azospirillum lipoferum]